MILAGMQELKNERSLNELGARPARHTPGAESWVVLPRCACISGNGERLKRIGHWNVARASRPSISG
jgi:hypothetical protein